MILSNIKEFLGRNKKILYYISLFFIVSFFTSDVTFAKDAVTWTDVVTTVTTKDTLAQSIAKWANEFLSVVSLFTWIITYLATMFLSPEWVNGSLFWMSEKFKTIWIMVSNIVYFVFAFILIWIAFMNIIWKNADQYQLKQALPKFIVWVLIVPFSWFLVQFILSISAILTVSALTLPYDSFPQYKNALDRIEIPTNCNIALGKKPKNWEFFDCWWKDAATIPLSKIMNNWDSSTSIYWILAMYTFWVTGMSDVDSIKFDESSDLRNLWDIAMKLIFDVLFIAIYFILIVALWLVLMIRWIYIWIYIMLSPIFWLMYFFDKKDWWDWFFAKFNLKEFIALAMVPVYTMLALSFWMLFLYVVWTWLTLKSDNNINSFQIVSFKDDWIDKSSIIIWNDYQIALTISWILWTNSEKINKLIGEWKNNVLWFIWILILKLFGIVILWWTVMAAMRTSEITKTIVEPLHQFGTKVWGIVTSAPWNIPIFGGQSMNSASNIAWQIQWWISSNQSKKASEFLNKHPFLPWSNWAAQISELTQIKNKMMGSKGDWRLQIQSLEQWLIKAGSANSARELEASRALLLEALNNLGLNKDNKFNIKNLEDVTIYNDAISKVDKEAKAKYHLDFIPGKNWAIESKDIDAFIKKWKVSDYDSSTNNDNNISSQVVNNNYVFDLPWIWKINWKIEKDWSQVVWFNDTDYKDLARYINTNIKTRDDFNAFLNTLNVKDDKIDDIMDAIWKYFKEWKMDLSQNSWNGDDLKKLFIS